VAKFLRIHFGRRAEQEPRKKENQQRRLPPVRSEIAKSIAVPDAEGADTSQREEDTANLSFKPDDQSLFSSAHEVAYAELAQALLSNLAYVDSPGSEQMFIREAAEKVRGASRRLPEFYSGEFLNLFKDAAVSQTRVAVEDCRRLIAEANAEADAASAELEERLSAARAADDYEAEHAVWRDREIRQAACQAKIDIARARMEPMSLRLEAVEGLAAALRLSFE
jgi:hypothetical protein